MTAARCFLSVVAALVVAGCSTVGNGRLVELDAAAAHAMLVPGTTTQADVRRALGDGEVVRFQSGMQTWHYVYREGLAKDWDDVPFINLIAARLDAPTKELVLLFDATGVLRRWSLQTYRNREPQPKATSSSDQGHLPKVIASVTI